MTDAINKCSANETAACCCVDVGTIMDNTDCSAAYSRVFDSRAAAEAMLASLTQKARSVESDPCDIRARFTELSHGVQLDVDFVFACEAETLIFQLGLR
ncbi:YfcZ/YiiS family protein [Pantoea sp. B65]|uniref:YfcZ/YiiS family protein n=1 Tax=Pantoea sp. B65 TaxID=2813359 RepID=UPI0039B5E0E5